jgi:DHA3 family macrolide efflux protein-like MFS transporter
MYFSNLEVLLQRFQHLSGMLGFSIVWLGQIVSVLASMMTQFALTIWVFEKTGSVTALGLVQVFFITPFLLLSPIAGVMVDRHNRKLMMAVSDLASGLGTLATLVLQALGMLEIWHLYAAAVFNGLGNTFQWPAYSAAISTMMPKEQYSRANGMMSLIDSGPGVFAPLLAGALLPFAGLTGILTFDVVTFILAIGALMIVVVPPPVRTQDGAKGAGNLWQESLFGFRYIFERPSLLGLQLIFLFGNLFAGIGGTLLAPMILSRTGNDSVSFGMVESAGAIGGVVGGILFSAWGGFKRRVHGVLLGFAFSSLFMAVLVGVGRSLPFWLVLMFIGMVFVPMVGASNQTIWQSKVAPDVQGRVFSARRLIAWLTNPITPILAGTLADYVLEPAMRAPGGFSNFFGNWVGTGPGAGMALLMVFCGLGGMLVGLSGYFIPAIRDAETSLPDHDAPPIPEPTVA